MRNDASGALDPLESASTMSVEQLEAALTAILRTDQPTLSLSDKDPDGSPKIPSLVAVLLVSRVGKAVGREKLVNLAKVDKADLQSVRGVARLAHAQIQTLQPVPA